MTNFLYNPDRKSKEQLIAEFVVRTDVFDEIMHDLETSDMKTPEQHYLLVGQRGSGKTTLLNRIKYAVEDSEKLRDWLIPVIFSEEQYNISELANLWENVAQVLEDYYGFEGFPDKMNKYFDEKNFEERAYEVLESELKQRGKKLLLLIDNVGDFLKKLDDKEVRRLREILQTKSDIRLIGGSSFYLESVLDYKQPLFEFFKVLRLDGLTESETQELLLKLGEVYDEQEKITTIIRERPERIETLRVLTGGVPRTIALMFNIFIDYEHESSIRDLERILDAVTPLYKHRMDDLFTQQQKIVDAVAKNWDPISVKELKAKVRMDSKIVSAQLRQLEKNQIIEKRETGTKNHLYLLRERFFNIWYLMRYGRKSDRQRVVWLVRFLESWCTNSELEKRILSFVGEIKNNKISDEGINFFGDVYSSLKNLTLQAKMALKQSMPEKIGSKINLNKDEITKLAEQSFQNDDFKGTINWLSGLDVLSKNARLLALDSLFELVKTGDILRKDTIHILIPANLDDLNGARITIMSIGCLIILRQDLYGENLSPEEFQLRMVVCFMLLSLQRSFHEDVIENEIGPELELLTFALNKANSMSLLNSVIDIFENSAKVESIIGVKIDFHTTLEPIYHALLIVTKRMDYSKIPPEKEQLIRNIVESITSKD